MVMFDAYYDQAIDRECLDCIVRALVELVPYWDRVMAYSSNVMVEIQAVPTLPDLDADNNWVRLVTHQSTVHHRYGNTTEKSTHTKKKKKRKQKHTENKSIRKWKLEYQNTSTSSTQSKLNHFTVFFSFAYISIICIDWKERKKENKTKKKKNGSVHFGLLLRRSFARSFCKLKR